MSLKGFFRTLIYSGLISLVLFTPFIHSEKLYNGIVTAKQFWFYGSMALLMSAFGIGFVFHRKSYTLSLNIIDISLILFYLYFLIRATLTPYTPLIYNTRFLNYSLLFVFYFVVKIIVSGTNLNKDSSSLNDVKKKREDISYTEILVVVLISTGLVQAIWGLLQLYDITKSFHSGFKITGIFFNPAPYALYLSAIFPIAFGTLLQSKNDKRSANDGKLMTALKNDSKLITQNGPMFLKLKNLKFVRNTILSYVVQSLHSQIPLFLNYFNPSLMFHKLRNIISLLTVTSIILVLPATMIRAAWVAVLISASLIIILKFSLIDKAKIFFKSRIRIILALIFILFIVGLSGACLFNLKKGSSTGKLLIWEVTLGKIIKKPLFGHGVGRFEAEYNNWQADYFKAHSNEMDGPKGIVAGNTKYCFNEYLEMASEIGLIGLLLFLSVIASIVFGIKNGIMTINDARSVNDNQMTCAAQMTTLCRTKRK